MMMMMMMMMMVGRGMAFASDPRIDSNIGSAVTELRTRTKVMLMSVRFAVILD